MNITPAQRAAHYQAANLKRPPLATTDEWITGTWAIGACYKNPNPLYGAYPHGYLERVHSMFPDVRSILHVFSGGLTVKRAEREARHSGEQQELRVGKNVKRYPELDIELVDIHGPAEGRYPTWQGDMFNMPEAWAGRFDLILADPPYSAADAEKYDTPMVNRAKVIRHLRKFASPGGTMVWLDVVWPMHRKVEWKTYGQIGLVRSTNHRVRLVTMFEAV